MSHLESPLARACEQLGMQTLAKHLAVSYQAIQKWSRVGRLPRTEWTGETAYAEKIESLTGGAVTKAQLLGPWPKPELQVQGEQVRDAA